jgi:hypothetical protein
MKKLSIIYLVLIVGLIGLTAPAAGMTEIWSSANTTVVIKPGYSIEFENPLTGITQMGEYTIIEWLDAEFHLGPPKNWEDWVPSDTTINGTSNQIWLRNQGQWAMTATTVPSTVVSIHVTGDDNDGPMDIEVDNVLVAQVDGNTPIGGDQHPAVVYVTGLANTTHTIEVICATAVPNNDVAILGAAALRKSIPTLNQWGMVILFLLLAAAATVVIRRRRWVTG